LDPKKRHFFDFFRLFRVFRKKEIARLMPHSTRTVQKTGFQKKGKKRQKIQRSKKTIHKKENDPKKVSIKKKGQKTQKSIPSLR